MMKRSVFVVLQAGCNEVSLKSKSTLDEPDGTYGTDRTDGTYLIGDLQGLFETNG
jgi:hypothetical protein